MSESTDPPRVVAAESRMTKLFDVRYVIAGLLGVYGVVLVVRGCSTGPPRSPAQPGPP